MSGLLRFGSRWRIPKMFGNHARDLADELEERDRELQNLKAEYAQFLVIQQDIMLRQQDAVVALVVELQAERERARYVEQRFEPVCGGLMLLEQAVSRLQSNGGEAGNGSRIIVPSYTAQKS